MPFGEISLEDKYLKDTGRVYLTAMEALARLPLMQRRRDLARGLNTAGYISGYRGSPLGRLDTTLWTASSYLAQHHIVFQPGVNEDLAATAISGTQQTEIWGNAKYDGVFALWYGKGPGVDRSGDALRHAQFAGTSRHGGVLLVAGDDQGAQSSTITQYSEHALSAYHIPVLYPATVQEILDYGLAGWAASRFAGLWIALKLTADLADAAQPVELGDGGPAIALPENVTMPADGLNIRWPDPVVNQETRLWRYRVPTLLAFVRANRMDRVTLASAKPRFGIVAAGKAHQDTLQALRDLGIGHKEAERLGLTIYKPALIWPLEPEGLVAFARGLDEILVVEDGIGILERQVRDFLYDLPAGERPRVSGKRGGGGQAPLPSWGELTPAAVARAIARRLGTASLPPPAGQHLAFLDEREAALAAPRESLERTPYFCSGCPHNTSTRVPEGSHAFAGIGCHVMAMGMERETRTWTQMGAEGMTWCGLAPFSNMPHAFINLGDGTYYHSGYLAIRAAIASGVNVTYKILYNDAVAMTGGQPVDGPLTPQGITHQLAGEGVGRIAVVTDQPEELPPRSEFAPLCTFHHRDDLDAVQRELREWPGVSVLLYVQTCATEKRRRRKRGLVKDPDKRVFINERVCEGCGDCGVQSNCLSILPLETEFGRKRAIDQSACNKDYSCLNGFCPSFVTVEGAKPRRWPAADADEKRFARLPAPTLPDTDTPYGIVLAGIGGTGVVTVSSLLGVAAFLDGKGVSQLDLTGMAQKFGSVVSHVWIANRQERIATTRVAEGGARLLFGPDILTSASADVLRTLRPGTTRAVINTYEQLTGEFTRHGDLRMPTAWLRRTIEAGCAADGVSYVDATRLATTLMGDAIGANMFLLGYAWQKGLIPVTEESLFKAVEFNGVAVNANKRIFRWGRLAAHAPEEVAAVVNAFAPKPASQRLSVSLDELIERRIQDLRAYQNENYAQRYRIFVRRVEAVERARTPGLSGLTEAVARYYYKLLAYKDEYEVARLFTDPAFRAALNDQFEGKFKLRFHMAPPLLGEKDARGLPKKRVFGPWMMVMLRVLARLKGLRGTPFDPFGYSAERRMERRLIGAYEAVIEEILAHLDHYNHRLAVEIASIPEHIRGFGHVKNRHLAAAKAREAELLDAFRKPPAAATAAE